MGIFFLPAELGTRSFSLIAIRLLSLAGPVARTRRASSVIVGRMNRRLARMVAVAFHLHPLVGLVGHADGSVVFEGSLRGIREVGIPIVDRNRLAAISLASSNERFEQ